MQIIHEIVDNCMVLTVDKCEAGASPANEVSHQSTNIGIITSIRRSQGVVVIMNSLLLLLCSRVLPILKARKLVRSEIENIRKYAEMTQCQNIQHTIHGS